MAHDNMVRDIGNFPDTILSHYDFYESMESCEPFGGGHINDTFRVRAKGGGYTVQRINTNVFTKPDALMENIWRVTTFLAKKIAKSGGDVSRETLTVVKNRNGELYTRGDDGSCWRVYKFIDDVESFDTSPNREDFYNAMYAFGKFQQMLADFPVASLHETIPHFHDTPRRFHSLFDAAKLDKCKRAASVKPEHDFFAARERDTHIYANSFAAGDIPLRVTHNDTKINNVLLDKKTMRGVCVIDLDTVMPGFAGFDFGEAIRTGASTGAEDEVDLAKVSIDEELFRTGLEGFLAGCGASLCGAEIALFPLGAKIMTLENGMRMLTDYLSGDVYYKISRETQNLDRSRAQIVLVKDFEAKEKRLNEIVAKVAGETR